MQYNLQIPLSPSVTSDDGSEDSVDDEAMDCGHSLNDAEHAVDYSQRRAVQAWNRYRRDHPKACGGRPATVLDQRFRLMDLPCELRRRVIGLVIGGRSRVAHMDANGSAGLSERQRGFPVDVRLFAVSKAMKKEAMAVFFLDNIFKIPIWLEGAFCSVPLFMRSEAKSWPLECLKRVEVDIEVDSYYSTKQLIPFVKIVCDVLSRCRQLIEVRFSPFCVRSNYTGLHDATCDELLEMFEVVKGVSRVVFSTDEELRFRHGPRDDRPYDDYYTIVGTETVKKRVTKAMMSECWMKPLIDPLCWMLCHDSSIIKNDSLCVSTRLDANAKSDRKTLSISMTAHRRA